MPRVMAYNATVERQVGSKVSVTAGYVGNSGRHVYAGSGPNNNINTPFFIPGDPNTN